MNRIDLSSEADLQRRIDARTASESVRHHERCRRCRKRIPDSRRKDAAYCSERCHRDYRREQQTALRGEVRQEARRLLAPALCPCGEPLNALGKSGPAPLACKKCRDRRNGKAYRERRLADETLP